MATIERATRLLETRLEEVAKERASLMEALALLERRVAPRHTASSPRHRRPSRAARGQRQAEFLAAIKQRPGASMSEIARRMGVSPQQLYPIARRLKENGAAAKQNRGYAASKDSRKPAGTRTG